MATPASAHTDARLSNFATSYDPEGFVADIVSPIVPVEKLSDVYTKRSRRDVNRVPDDLAGPRSALNEVSYDLSTGSYSCKERGLKEVVTGSYAINADAPIDPFQAATMNIKNKLMLNREVRVATLLQTSSNYSSSNVIAAASTWATGGSTPITNINAAKRAIPRAGGGSKLVAVCSTPLFDTLKQHADILALKGTTDGMATEEEIAKYFGFAQLVVSDVTKDTANDGQTASYSYVWSSSYFVIIRVPTVIVGPDITAFSVTFRQKSGFVSRKWRDENLGLDGADWVSLGMRDDEVVPQNDMGAIITGV